MENICKPVKADTADLARRKEWEFEVPRNRPDFKATKAPNLNLY